MENGGDRRDNVDDRPHEGTEAANDGDACIEPVTRTKETEQDTAWDYKWTARVL